MSKRTRTVSSDEDLPARKLSDSVSRRIEPENLINITIDQLRDLKALDERNGKSLSLT